MMIIMIIKYFRFSYETKKNEFFPQSVYRMYMYKNVNNDILKSLFFIIRYVGCWKIYEVSLRKQFPISIWIVLLFFFVIVKCKALRRNVDGAFTVSNNMGSPLLVRCVWSYHHQIFRLFSSFAVHNPHGSEKKIVYRYE